MAKSYWDTLPPKQIRLAQESKLIWYLREKVYPYSPYYRKLFDQQGINPRKIQTLKDFQNIPFTTKADIAPSPDEPDRPLQFVLDPQSREDKERGRLKNWWARLTLGKEKFEKRVLDEFNPSHVHFTTGRTALPTPIFYTPYDLELTRECGRRIGELFELNQTDVFVNAFPFAPHLAFWMAYLTADVLHIKSIHTGGGRIMEPNRILELLQRFRGTILVSTPSYCYHLLRKAAAINADLSSLKTLVLGADHVPAGLKKKINDMLKNSGAEEAITLASYAFTEGRVAWGECRPSVIKGVSSGYHLFPDREIIEIIDPETGEVVGEGEEGEVVYTSLNWRGSVLLRYRTGDLVKEGISYEPCPYCGRTVPRLGSTITRLSEYKEFNLTKVKGELVDLNAFYPLLSGHPEVQEWQLELRKHNDDPYDLDELYLYIAPLEGVDLENLGKELEVLVKTDLGVIPNRIIFMDLEELLERLGMDTQAKERRIVDARPIA